MDGIQGNVLLGATLLGHAVEGANYASDWWQWEQRPGRIRGEATSQNAAGHFERYADDLNLAARFGLNALLIGVEWSRIAPNEGTFDEDALAHYDDVITRARDLGITPFVVLHHVAAPLWFATRYGWGHRRAPELFAEYAARMVDALGRVCERWIPWHEPMNWFVNAALERRWPSGPGVTALPRTLGNIRAALGRAYDIIKAANPQAQVGYTVRARRFAPSNAASVWDQRAAHRAQRFCNRIVARPSQFDFLGVSFFGVEEIRYSLWNPRQGFAKRPARAENLPDEPLGTPDAEGLRQVVRDFGGFGKPLYFTGGIATNNDDARAAYLGQVLGVLREERARGGDIRGYFHHALLDGFEWTSGYDRRYGLIHVDSKTLSRTPNKSAFAIARLATQDSAVHPRKAART